MQVVFKIHKINIWDLEMIMTETDVALLTYHSLVGAFYFRLLMETAPVIRANR